MKPKKKFAWSYSSLKDYETCPLKRKFRQEKVPTKPNKYIDRGIMIHTLAEKFLKNELSRVPKELSQVADEMKRLRRLGACAEGQYAFDRAWRPVEWFDKDAWFRAKMDATYGEMTPHIEVIDFKTGRPRDYTEQSRIYGLSALLMHKMPTHVSARFLFTDHGVFLPERPLVYSRKTVMGFRRELEVRAARMERESKFNPRPGAHCAYCDYSKRKDGPCKY